MKQETIIQVEGLGKRYGEVVALDDVSFSVRRGEIFGLLGPNGAGKTTLIEIICGLRRFDAGKVTILGFDLVKDSYKIRSLIGFCSQETLLYDLLSVKENFAFAASLYSLRSKEYKEKLNHLSKFLGIEEFLNRRTKELSGGMKRRANLAVSIIHDPQIIVLDEPTVGFDPNVKREFWELIKRLRENGKTVLLSTHDMYEADELCDNVAIMDKGKIVALDKPYILKEKFGGRTLISIKLKDPLTNEKLALFEKYNAIFKDGEIQISTRNPWKLMPELTKKLISKGLLTEKIEVTEPTLEDVFIKLTGRRLMEGTVK